MSAESTDRLQLFDQLAALPSTQFEALLFALKIPIGIVSGPRAPQGNRAKDLLDWAEGATGPNLKQLVAVLKRVLAGEIGAAQIDFETYLRSLISTYEQWWKLYTLTDAIAQKKGHKCPPLFDFGLTVQNVSQERDSTGVAGTSLQDKHEETEILPVLEGIHRYAADHVLLVGRPGSGKSTALIRLLPEMAIQTLEQGIGSIPILIELRYWKISILERIQAFFYKHDPALNLDDGVLISLLRQGRFLLLIDGLNELPSEAARTQLSSFRHDHSRVPMIFTSRDLSLGGDLGIEKKLEMQPLTEPQMKEFIHAYVPDQAEGMLRQLNHRLREFCQTPLLLWMLCEVFQQAPDHQMPSNLAGVFQRFTVMYEDSSVRKHEVALLKGDVKPLSDRRLWKPALQALASVMMHGTTLVDFRVVIHRDEAEHELNRICNREKFPARDLLDDLLKYHLLQNRSTDQVEFHHQLIQEYYAAEHLLQTLPKLSEKQLKRDYLNYLKWTEPIFLMMALIYDAEKVSSLIILALQLDRLLGAKFSNEFQPILRLKAVGWIPYSRLEKSPEACSVDLKTWSVELENFENAFNKSRIDSFSHLSEVMDLKGKKDPESIQKLFAFLEHKEGDIRLMASYILRKIGSEDIILHFLESLAVENDHDVCRCMVSAIVESNKPAVIPELWRLCLEHQNRKVSEEILDAIIAIQNHFKFYNHEIWEEALVVQNKKL
jgi:hypothetical protein